MFINYNAKDNDVLTKEVIEMISNLKKNGTMISASKKSLPKRLRDAVTSFNSIREDKGFSHSRINMSGSAMINESNDQTEESIK